MQMYLSYVETIKRGKGNEKQITQNCLPEDTGKRNSENLYRSMVAFCKEVE